MAERPTAAELSEMTVNQRLYALGLLSKWEDAASAHEKPEMIAVLCEAAFTPEQAEWIATTVLADPEKYGY